MTSGRESWAQRRQPAAPSWADGAQADGTAPLYLDLEERPADGARDRAATARVATPLAAQRHSVPAPGPDAAGPALPGPATPPAGPGVATAGNRLFVTLLFWFGLAAGIEAWWWDNPTGSVSDASSALIAAGSITGLVGGYVLLAEVLMMSRVGWLEQWVGAHSLLRWHRSLGGYLVVLIPGHAVLLVYGYALAAHASPVRETWTVLRTYQDMVSAFVATGILVAVGVLAVRAVRRRLPYELWHGLHLATYLVLLFGYGHQFADGPELSVPGFAHWYWLSLYAFVLSCLVWGRAVEPGWLNTRHRFRVLAVRAEGRDTLSVYIGGRRLERLDARAGQYFRWRFLARGCWWQAHPFSLSAAPNPQWLRVTVKVVGDHTADLARLRAGTRVVAEGPCGAFTADRRVRHRALLIAGGSGIAPIRALLEVLPPETIVLYRASAESDLVFRTELEELARQRGARVWFVLGARDEPGPRHLFTPAGIRELVPDVRRRDVYLCGPEGLVATSRRVLRRLRVPRRQIHLDPFEF